MAMGNSGMVRIGLLYEEGKNACLKNYQNFITSSVIITIHIFGIRAIYPYEFTTQPLCQKKSCHNQRNFHANKAVHAVLPIMPVSQN